MTTPVPTTGEQAKELNSTTTLAAENARLREALQEVVTAITNEIASDEEPCWSAVFDNVLIIASAELRGGAK